MYRRTLRIPSRRRAMTLPEMMISVAVFSTVAIFVSFVTIAIARQSKDDLINAPAEAHVFRTMDFIRNNLMTAQYGSVKFWDDNTRVTYLNPNTNRNCSITFNPTTKRCIFDPDTTTANNEIPWGRGITGRFALSSTPKRVIVTVTSTYKDTKRTYTTSYQDVMTIRN